MPLPRRLYDTLLTHTCPHCGHKNEKLGSYFWRMRQYHCPACEKAVPLTYEDKLKLFDQHGPSLAQA
jgi:transposase-like protein